MKKIACLLFLTILVLFSCQSKIEEANELKEQGDKLRRNNVFKNDSVSLEALKCYKKSFELYPNEEIEIRISKSLMDLERYKESLHILKKLFNKNKKNIDIIINIGTVNDLMGKQKESLKYYLKAHELKPDHVIIVFTVARIYAKMNDKDNMFLYLKKLLEFDNGAFGLTEYHRDFEKYTEDPEYIELWKEYRPKVIY